jgi:hypothetical protein
LSACVPARRGERNWQGEEEEEEEEEEVKLVWYLETPKTDLGSKPIKCFFQGSQ